MPETGGATMSFHEASRFNRAVKPLDIASIRSDFPILAQRIYGKPLVYFDNAATTQKPRAVIDAIRRFYEESNSNIHRGIHFLSQKATDAYEETRTLIQQFLGAGEREEIVFVRGTTEAINLVAHGYCRPRLHEGDEVLITGMEHHSNIVPWQMVCEETGARLRVAPVDDRGEVDREGFRKLLGPRTRFVSIVHVSNALGTINPVRELAAEAHVQGAEVLIDGAQAISHLAVDVRDLDCDFYAFSGHKTYGPTGIGALYGRRELLESMSPYQGGGDMIASVSFDRTIYADVPHKFEAGTPNIADTVGLAAAIRYVLGLGLDRIAQHEQDLLRYATAAIEEVGGVRILGTAEQKASVISLLFDEVHPHDAGTILDREGIAVRAGHHCAQPLMERFGVTATVRASLAFYNTREEVDAFIRAIHKVREVFR